MKPEESNVLPKPYQVVTDRIIQMLEQGVVPWKRPWNSTGAPKNLHSGKDYRGINTFMLSAGGAASGFTSPYWVTFKQALERGGSVRKGEHGMPVVFWKLLDRRGSSEDEVDDNESGESKKIPMIRYSTVFNVEQCDGLEYPTPEVASHDFDPIIACEQIVQQMPRPPTIQHDGSRAYYRPSADSITMPPANLFEVPAEYYAPLFHEMTHATGHKSRLNRDGIEKGVSFGSPGYAREELIAEMGAAFLCSRAAIDTLIIENSASYLNGWLKALKGDPKLVVIAASQAQKAVDYITGAKEERIQTINPNPNTAAAAAAEVHHRGFER